MLPIGIIYIQHRLVYTYPYFINNTLYQPITRHSHINHTNLHYNIHVGATLCKCTNDLSLAVLGGNMESSLTMLWVGINIQ